MDVKTARKLIADEATSEVTAAADLAVVKHQASWMEDPHVRGTIGLIKRGTNKAAIVVYWDGSWEVDEELLDEVSTALRFPEVAS